MTTLEEVKEYLGITSTEYDTLLADLIVQASAMVENITGKTFSEVTDHIEAITGHDEPQINLNHYPVTETTTRVLEKSLGHTNEDDWEVVEEESYWVDVDTGIVDANFDFVCGFDNYRLTYSYGYITVPADITLATNIIIGALFNNRGADGIKSEKIGDYAITYKDTVENATVMKILNQYLT